MLCGFGYLPYAAAKDGVFFSFFAHESERHPGLADRSLLLVVLLTIPWCFFSLDVVIDAMTTCLVLVQFVGQGVGLLYYRWRVQATNQPPGWRMPLFPLPVIVQIVIFSFIWISSDSTLLWGSDQPILEVATLFLLLGPCVFFAKSRWRQEWPFKIQKPAECPVAADDGKPEEKVDETDSNLPFGNNTHVPEVTVRLPMPLHPPESDESSSHCPTIATDGGPVLKIPESNPVPVAGPGADQSDQSGGTKITKVEL